VRRLVLRQPWQLELEAVEPSALTEGDVRVAVGATGICASDVHGYAGRSSRRAPGTVMGHEVAGTVVEAGPGAVAPAVGDRVALDPVVWCGSCSLCRAGHTHLCATRRLYGCTPALPGGFAQEIVVRAENVVPLDPRLTFEVASLIEPLAVGVHAASRGELSGDAAALVLGAGMIGLATALAAARSAASVVVAEPDADRRRAAEDLGLAARDPGELESGAYDVVFECVGGIGLLDAAVAHARPRGRVVAVGLADEQVPLSMSPLVMEERTIVGSAVYAHQEFAATAAWAAGEHERLARLVEGRVGLDELAATIDDLANGRARLIRTVLTPG
jgi:2-desacetyl-2-hydroxyethyl bacteriochlorophyllide A dehydrogenase